MDFVGGRLSLSEHINKYFKRSFSVGLVLLVASSAWTPVYLPAGLVYS